MMFNVCFNCGEEFLTEDCDNPFAYCEDCLGIGYEEDKDGWIDDDEQE